MKMPHRLFLFIPNKKKKKKNEDDPQANSKEFMRMFNKFSKNFRILFSLITTCQCELIYFCHGIVCLAFERSKKLSLFYIKLF